MPKKRPGRLRSNGTSPRRVAWLRGLAVFWGAFVLIGHVSTYGEYVRGLDLPPDLVQHVTGVGVFALLYRASWRAQPGGVLAITAVTLLVCCGWGALCESLQLFVPQRDFQMRELVFNSATPAAVIAIYSLAEVLVNIPETG